MSDLREALRLARELEACPTINYKDHAAELRRLSAVNQELLEALNAILNGHGDPDIPEAALAKARAAIARAEGKV
jgi:hypothetical protein